MYVTYGERMQINFELVRLSASHFGLKQYMNEIMVFTGRHPASQVFARWPLASLVFAGRPLALLNFVGATPGVPEFGAQPR
jgi:uncharacterized membrane protein